VMVAASGVGQIQHPDRLPLALLTGELKPEFPVETLGTVLSGLPR